MEKFFKDLVDSNMAEYDDFPNDVIRYGCVSGCVPELVYYSQTNGIFEKYEDDLIDWAESVGFEEMIKNGYIETWDVLLGLHSAKNRCLLIWAAFEDYVNQYYQKGN